MVGNRSLSSFPEVILKLIMESCTLDTLLAFEIVLPKLRSLVSTETSIWSSLLQSRGIRLYEGVAVQVASSSLKKLCATIGKSPGDYLNLDESGMAKALQAADMLQFSNLWPRGRQWGHVWPKASSWALPYRVSHMSSYFWPGCRWASHSKRGRLRMPNDGVQFLKACFQRNLDPVTTAPWPDSIGVQEKTGARLFIDMRSTRLELKLPSSSGLILGAHLDFDLGFLSDNDTGEHELHLYVSIDVQELFDKSSLQEPIHTGIMDHAVIRSTMSMPSVHAIICSSTTQMISFPSEHHGLWQAHRLFSVVGNAALPQAASDILNALTSESGLTVIVGSEDPAWK
eukprot:gnl/TRDRNA2_/TRDRNA2_200562_c0_seq1.p1 gnl/TRDRNA2_/TRDRNA2_200562_c0~~gnl/TRDRNA2_/TRDRNA2_200562_c0_seq1.p1  ORF type:complete len:342 (+),score=35.51 gnl/TRDRNA2_/TRDRNA2_200562_c0_seq1:49-1074(+)